MFVYENQGRLEARRRLAHDVVHREYRGKLWRYLIAKQRRISEFAEEGPSENKLTDYRS